MSNFLNISFKELLEKGRVFCLKRLGWLFILLLVFELLFVSSIALKYLKIEGRVDLGFYVPLALNKRLLDSFFTEMQQRHQEFLQISQESPRSIFNSEQK